jgi:EAL domain-containing protein (putative c-di-GMP-specific phosphodiesterase class I)
MRKDLVENALQHSRPGDVLFLATESSDSESQDFLAAAQALRNLMAFPAAVDVLDRALLLNGNNLRALEQKALCLSRQGRDYASEAEALLDQAIALAAPDSDAARSSESLSILARLNKERWCRSWFNADVPESDAQIAENCGDAVKASYYLWSAIDCYLDAFEQTQSYYNAINATTLLALATHLNARVPESQARPASVAETQFRELTEKARPLISQANDASKANSSEDAYWALATQLEWVLVNGDDSDAECVARIPAQAGQLIRKAGLRRFLLDSTVNQFRLFRALGFRPDVTGPALESLENALNFVPDPSLPAHRIIYFNGRVDADQRFSLSSPEEEESAPAEQIEAAIKDARERYPDSIVLMPAMSLGAVVAAEVCKAGGIPYELFSPVAADALEASWLGRASGDLSSRFAAVRRKARTFSVLANCVGTDAEAADDVRMAKWVYDTARAYGERVTVVLDVDGRMISVPGAALTINASDGQSLCLSASDVARLKDGSTEAAAPESIEPSGDFATNVSIAEPSLDVEIASFYDYCSQEGARTRWNSYSDTARGFLMSIGLTFEPFGLVAPVLLERNTLGFEILTEGPNGMRYGEVMAERERLGIDQLDIELVVLLKGLNAIQSLRRRLRMALGLHADSLLMSVNVADMLLKAPEFVDVVARYRLDEMSLFEIHEGLALDNVSRVRQLADTYRLRLALDDSNDMAPDVRSALFDKVDLIKVDFKFTREKLSRVGDDSPQRIIEELVHLRQPDMPLVIEGIESEEDVIFIQNHWKKDYGYLYCQGWAVQVSRLLMPFFEPCNTPDFPKGYRVVPEAGGR